MMFFSYNPKTCENLHPELHFFHCIYCLVSFVYGSDTASLPIWLTKVLRPGELTDNDAFLYRRDAAKDMLIDINYFIVFI